MSIESILLVAFLLFPLLERLTQFLRRRAAHASGDSAAAGPRPQPVPTQRAPAVADAGPVASGPVGLPTRLPSPVVSPLPRAPRHPAIERLTTSERVRAWRQSHADEATPAAGEHAQPRARRSAFHVSRRADLRRAVILTAILDRCKALENEARPR